MGNKSFWGIAIGFLILTAGFFVVERISPGIKGQRMLRRGFWTDVIYWFFTPLITRSITTFLKFIPAILLLGLMGFSLAELKNYQGFAPVNRQPWWLQGLEIFVLSDLVGYWSHRMFHTGRWWPFHAVHHSSEELDWLSSTRLHPVNDIVSKLLQTFPALLLGFTPTVLAAFVPALTLYSIVLHANVNWTYGPLRGVIASPVFHRWHHTKESEALDKNFAGFFPFLDMIFGTYYMPKGRVPTEFGIDDQMPENVVAQLAYPFGKRRALPAPAPAAANPVESGSPAS
jgi:sterol desaturase/sphingolipid hydroxylase (fatty acid hydroxylase superfamily)